MLATVCTRQEDDTKFFKSRSNEWCVEEKEDNRVGEDYFLAKKEVMNFLKFFLFLPVNLVFCSKHWWKYGTWVKEFWSY